MTASGVLSAADEVNSVTAAGSHQGARAKAGVWLAEIRPLFLLGLAALAFEGISVARSDGSFDIRRADAAFVGLTPSVIDTPTPLM